MAINIKNEQVAELARHAAHLAGTSQTGAIEQALRQFIAQREAATSPSRVEVVWQTLDAIDARLGQAQYDAMQSVMDGLHDEAGLPA